MQVHPEVDAVMVGTGWTGSIMAQQLTAAGLEVVALERGRAQWTYPDFAHNHDYLRYAHRMALLQDLSKETWTWRPNAGAPSLPFREHGSKTVGQGLGGTGVHWAGGAWRFLPTDFRYRSHHIERYGAGKIPEGCTVQDWPISYDDLEPFYDRFEYDVGVSGEAGNIEGRIAGDGSPFEGWRSRPFPLPPLETQIHGDMFAEACRSLGYHPYSAPSALLSRGYTDVSGQPRAACLYCGYCSLFGCEADAKGTPMTTYLPAALDTGRYEIRTHSTVVGIEMNDAGLATGLRYMDRQGREHLQPAARVFLTGFTFTNIRLLLLSHTRDHPDGVGNNQGLVGRNYTDQLVSEPVTGTFEGRRFNLYMGNTDTRVCIQDYYGDVFDHSDLDFIGGAHLRGGWGESDPIDALDENVFLEPADGEDEPRQWGQAFKDGMYTAFNSTFTLGMHAEDLPFESSFMDLDPTYTDSYGLPLLRLTHDWSDNQRNLHAFLAQRLGEIMAAMGPDRMDVEPELDDFGVGEGAVHPTGGAIMGTDPSNSVTNKYGQIWEVPNLFVAGASLYPQNPGSNPTETACALAYFTADAIRNGYLNRPEELMG